MNLHYIFPKIALYLLFTHAKKQFSFRLKNFLFIECGDWRPIWQLPTFEKLEFLKMTFPIVQYVLYVGTLFWQFINNFQAGVYAGILKYLVAVYEGNILYLHKSF